MTDPAAPPPRPPSPRLAVRRGAPSPPGPPPGWSTAPARRAPSRPCTPRGRSGTGPSGAGTDRAGAARRWRAAGGASRRAAPAPGPSSRRRARRARPPAGRTRGPRCGLRASTPGHRRSAWMPPRATGQPTRWPRVAQHQAVARGGRLAQREDGVGRPARPTAHPPRRRRTGVPPSSPGGPRSSRSGPGSADGAGGTVSGDSSPSVRSKPASTIGRRAVASGPRRDRGPPRCRRASGAAAPARPPSSTWATGTSGRTHSRPWSSSGSDRRAGEPTPSGWMAEHTSWVTPGSVSSAERRPPPGCQPPR